MWRSPGWGNSLERWRGPRVAGAVRPGVGSRGVQREVGPRGLQGWLKIAEALGSSGSWSGGFTPTDAHNVITAVHPWTSPGEQQVHHVVRQGRRRGGRGRLQQLGVRRESARHH